MGKKGWMKQETKGDAKKKKSNKTTRMIKEENIKDDNNVKQE